MIVLTFMPYLATFQCDTNTHDIFVLYENWFRNPNRIAEAMTEPVDDDYRKTLWHESCSAPSSFRGVYDFGNSFYSYKHGMAHIIVLNSYTNSSVGSAQYQWLEAELNERFDRQKTPWLLVTFHAPLYTTFLGHVNETEATSMKAAMEPLFVKYGVNIIVSGEYYRRKKKRIHDAQQVASLTFLLLIRQDTTTHTCGRIHSPLIGLM